MTNPKISVIVPVYNSETSLKRCLDSLLSQSYMDFELLIIDDGSTDKSSCICDTYVGQDERIKVFHKENEGVSAARNLGLEKAKGEWIAFCDSDDWVSRHYLENMMYYTKDETVDLVFSYATIVYADGTEKKEVFTERKIPSQNIEIAFLDNELHGHTAPWSKLFRKKVIDNMHLRFCEGVQIGEDAIFVYSFMMSCNCIYFASNADYFYNFETDKSLTKCVNDLDSELYCYEKVTSTIDLMCSKMNITNCLALRKIDWMRGYYVRRVLNALYHNDVNRKKRLQVINNLNLHSYLESVNIPAKKEKFLSFLLKKRLFRLYDFIRNIVRLYHKI